MPISKPREAIVLAGGMGTRLRSVVSDVPKPIAPVNSRPFLFYLFDFLKSQGIERIVLSIGYRAEKIVEVIKVYSSLDIQVCIENRPLGTGGAIQLALHHVNQKSVYVLNGDTYFPVSLSKMAKFHDSKSADITLALKPLKDNSRYGNVQLKDSRVITFTEKEEGKYINGGIYLMRKEILSEMVATPFSFERDSLPKLLHSHEVHGFIDDAYFLDLGIPEDYARAQLDASGWLAF